MKAVNLVPTEARSQRGAFSGRHRTLARGDAFGPGHLVLGVLVIIVALMALRVVSANDVNNKKATLAAVNAQVATEQTQAAKLNTYVSFVQAAQQREDQVRQIADQRFDWQQTLDQISQVMPASTTLSSLGANTGTVAADSSTDASSTTPSTTGTGPTFTLAGCADTVNQNGTATLLRRLQLLSHVTDVGFESSTRTPACGNSFSLTLTFSAPGAGSSTVASTGSAATAGVSTTASPTPATTTGGSAG